MNKQTSTITLLFMTTFVNAVGSGLGSPSTTQAPSTSPTEPIPAYKTYDYAGDRYRDPFIPLIGDGRMDSGGGPMTPPISSMQLKGIMEDSKGRMALLTSGANSYILRGGRLYDGKNRLLKKISGIVKTSSVVLIGADRTVQELKVTQNN